MTARPRIEMTDDLIEQMAAERAERRMPADLVETILSAAVVTPQRRTTVLPALPLVGASRARWLRIGILLALLALGISLVAGAVLQSRPTIGGGGPMVISKVEEPGAGLGKPVMMHVFGLDEGTGERTPIADWPIRGRTGHWGSPIRPDAKVGYGQSGWVTWSPDRQSVLFFDLDSRVQGIAEVANGALTPRSWLPADLDAAPGIDQIAWAPTSDRLAWVVYHDSGDPTGNGRTSEGPRSESVVIADVRGHALADLPLPPGADMTHLTWSPDGSAILLSGSHHILIVPVDGSSVRVLLDEPEIWNAAWSPDGSRIAYATADGIAALDVETAHVTQLTHGGDFQPTWAPDGRRIAFARREDLAEWLPAHVYVMDSDGAHLAPLSDGPDDEFPRWSPDGTQIMFERFGATYPSVWVVAPDGGDPRLIATDATADW